MAASVRARREINCRPASGEIRNTTRCVADCRRSPCRAYRAARARWRRRFAFSFALRRAPRQSVRRCGLRVDFMTDEPSPVCAGGSERGVTFVARRPVRTRSGVPRNSAPCRLHDRASGRTAADFTRRLPEIGRSRNCFPGMRVIAAEHAGKIEAHGRCRETDRVARLSEPERRNGRGHPSPRPDRRRNGPSAECPARGIRVQPGIP
jgi:hypothetical protein